MRILYMTVAAALIACPLPASAQGGAYQQSCRRYGVIDAGYLTAECAAGGRWLREERR